MPGLFSTFEGPVARCKPVADADLGNTQKTRGSSSRYCADSARQLDRLDLHELTDFIIDSDFDEQIIGEVFHRKGNSRPSGPAKTPKRLTSVASHSDYQSSNLPKLQ